MGPALASSALCALAFPPFGAWPLAFVAALPLLLGARRLADGAHGAGWLSVALGLYAGTVPLWLFEERWLVNVTLPGYPLLALYLALYAPLAVLLVAAITRRLGDRWFLLAAPLVWTGLEVLRGEWMLTGYAWFLAGHPLIEAPPLAAPGAVGGAYLVSFLTVAAGAAVVHGVSARARRVAGGMALGTVVLVWAVLAAAGLRSAAPDDVVRIAAIQTNVPQDNRAAWAPRQRIDDFLRFAELTRAAGAPGDAARPDVIVWPETMFPGLALNPEALERERAAGLTYRVQQPGGPDLRVPSMVFADELAALLDGVRVPMVVGAAAVENLRITSDETGAVTFAQDARYNAAFLLTPADPGAPIEDGRRHAGRYDKMRLTPFGEIIPVVWRWPAVSRAVLAVGARGMSFDLAMGGSTAPLSLERASGPPVRLAVPICFEASMSAQCRRLVYGEGGAAHVLVNISNDGWFAGFRGGREQHLLCARWRCVELGVPMVRAVNTGLSAWIDPRGRLLALGPDGVSTDAWVDGILRADVPFVSGERGTLFGRTGNVFGWSAVVGTAALLVAAVFRRRGAGVIEPGGPGGRY